MFFFVCSATLFYLQRSSFLFAAFLLFVCSVPFFIFAAVPFFVCRASFLFAAFLFCLQRSFFVCGVPFLFAAFLFCLQRFFFVCSVSFLFAAFLFCLQRFFFVCSVSLVGHRINVQGTAEGKDQETSNSKILWECLNVLPRPKSGLFVLFIFRKLYKFVLFSVPIFKSNFLREV